jgi:hypothetical protein
MLILVLSFPLMMFLMVLIILVLQVHCSTTLTRYDIAYVVQQVFLHIHDPQ